MSLLKQVIGSFSFIRGAQRDGELRNPRGKSSFLGSFGGYINRTYRKIHDRILTSFGYATNADVFAIVSTIAYKMSEVPVIVKTLNLNREYEINEDSDVHKILHDDPEETYKEKIIKDKIINGLW